MAKTNAGSLQLDDLYAPIYNSDGKLVRASVSGSIAASDAAGGVFYFRNPFTFKILITRLILDVTTASTGACTVDIGKAADATTSNDTLIDGLSTATAGIFDTMNVTDRGTNGKTVIKLDERGGTTSYVTASKASGATAGVVGKYYIEFRQIA